MTTTEAKLLLSASILMLRDSPELEVLLVKRHHEVDFASGAYVFPGGKIAPGDQAGDWENQTDGDFTGEELALRIGAIREAFEESGLLLARHANSRGVGAPLVGSDIALALAPMRAPVDRGEVDFLGLLKEHNLVLALDRLVHFGHWITPPMMPKRFDTHFYIASTPSDQTAEQDGRETTEAMWITPQDALEAEAAGTATIVFPTRLNIKRLTLAQTADDAMSKFSRMSVPTVMPELFKDESGSPCLRIPEVEGYGLTVEPLGKLMSVAKSQPTTS